MAKSKKEWEQKFIGTFVRLRDVYMEQEPMDLIGPKNAKIVESIIVGYFCERRPRIHIKEPSCYMNFEDIAIFINDIILNYINDEHPDLLELDWQQKYVLKSESQDLFFNEDDKENY